MTLKGVGKAYLRLHSNLKCPKILEVLRKNDTKENVSRPDLIAAAIIQCLLEKITWMWASGNQNESNKLRSGNMW